TRGDRSRRGCWRTLAACYRRCCNGFLSAACRLALLRWESSMNAIPPKPVPPLRNGDRLTQAEFHRRYEASPSPVKVELIGGVVYMASPLGRQHGFFSVDLLFLMELYVQATSGVELLNGATTILGEESEPEPDVSLRILPEYGGQSRTIPGRVEYVG